jgi:hypothetical protein
MAFNRKDRERRGRRDPFAHLQDERAQAETGDAWFLAPDEGPELDVQAGISSNLEQDDLGQRPERPGPPERHDPLDPLDGPAYAEPVQSLDKASEHPRREPPMAISMPPPAPLSVPVEPLPVARAELPMTQIQPVVVPPPLPRAQAPAPHEPVAPEPAMPTFTVPEPIPLFAEPFDSGPSSGKASSPDDPVDYASEVGLDVLSAAVAALGRNKPADERRDELPATQETAAVDDSDAALPDAARLEPEAD